ncbi:hypothetical protein K466DRAFT_603656 [Polyporus arcularius HHB13444]|uniref:Uncharacterized protein n=1 Tax=Polyporus arcularius HHB13444 TaxID=1314778 RepID=A0A5C3P1I0_9APHY|nr:hypothetical protein K466DRAFT_603656 [Polyporus arcularius HHB13444]
MAYPPVNVPLLPVDEAVKPRSAHGGQAAVVVEQPSTTAATRLMDVVQASSSVNVSNDSSNGGGETNSAPIHTPAREHEQIVPTIRETAVNMSYVDASQGDLRRTHSPDPPGPPQEPSEAASPDVQDGEGRRGSFIPAPDASLPAQEAEDLEIMPARDVSSTGRVEATSGLSHRVPAVLPARVAPGMTLPPGTLRPASDGTIVAGIRTAMHFRPPSGNLMLAHRRALTTTRELLSPLAGVVGRHEESRHSSAASTPALTATPLSSHGDIHDDDAIVFDEESGTVTGVPQRAPRGRRAVATQVDDDVLAFVQLRFPGRLRLRREITARSKLQTGAGYRNNIVVRLIVNTFIDLGLGTDNTDVKSREVEVGGRWIGVTTEDIVLAFGMAVSTFSTTRSHVETCYRVRQWMIDNTRHWNGVDDDGADKRLFDMLEAYCRRGVLPPITAPEAERLTRAERDALLCGARSLYLLAVDFMKRMKQIDGVNTTLQPVSVVYEPEP